MYLESIYTLSDKISAPTLNFGSYVRRKFFIGFLFSHTLNTKIYFNMSSLLSWHALNQLTKYFGDKFSAASHIFGRFIHRNFVFPGINFPGGLSLSTFNTERFLLKKVFQNVHNKKQKQFQEILSEVYGQYPIQKI